MLARLVLVLTTWPPRERDLAEAGLAHLAADLKREGWQLRFAGPRWDVVWARDWQVPMAARVLVLPDPGRSGRTEPWGRLVNRRLNRRAEALA